tara:strand:- start:1788 stop:2153 length:366 start_codon:yes stop_codon:yes gene_type:complete
MLKTFAFAAALLAAFFVTPSHAKDRVTTVAYVCLAETDIMELAALDERAGRTVNDIFLLMQSQIRGNKCFAFAPMPFREIFVIYTYKDARGLHSEVWRGLLPGGTTQTFTIVALKLNEDDA